MRYDKTTQQLKPSDAFNIFKMVDTFVTFVCSNLKQTSW